MEAGARGGSVVSQRRLPLLLVCDAPQELRGDGRVRRRVRAAARVALGVWRGGVYRIAKGFLVGPEELDLGVLELLVRARGAGLARTGRFVKARAAGIEGRVDVARRRQAAVEDKRRRAVVPGLEGASVGSHWPRLLHDPRETADEHVHARHHHQLLRLRRHAQQTRQRHRARAQQRPHRGPAARAGSTALVRRRQSSSASAVVAATRVPPARCFTLERFTKQRRAAAPQGGAERRRRPRMRPVVQNALEEMIEAQQKP